MACDYEIVCVNDGSRDASRRLLTEAAVADQRIKVLGFSRNFGHQAAITAGLDFAAGDAVVVMDADLQDPPQLLPEMVKLYEQGFDVVSAQRTDRQEEGLFKSATAAMFYSLMRRAIDARLQPQVGDFRLFSREAVVALRGFREQHRFLRGLVAWLGLREAIIPFSRPPRVAGTTKYPTRKMIRFAWTAISSFSALPLRLSLIAGLLLSAGLCLLARSALSDARAQLDSARLELDRVHPALIFRRNTHRAGTGGRLRRPHLRRSERPPLVRLDAGHESHAARRPPARGLRVVARDGESDEHVAKD